jgi:hypothetical protein
MPFKSEKQRRFLWAEHPEIAKRWAKEYPESNKGLPMRVNKDTTSDSKEKAAQFNVLALIAPYVNKRTTVNNSVVNSILDETVKNSEDQLIKVKIPHSDQPTYAGQEREHGEIQGEQPTMADTDGESAHIEQKKPENAINSLLQKISVVLSQSMAQALENRKAEQEARNPQYQPKNQGIKQYSAPTPVVPPPMGAAQAPAPQAQAAQPQQQQGVGMNSPSANPIKSFGPLSASGNINGNAAFGQKNSPDSLKTAAGNASLARIMGMDYSGLPDPEELDYEERMKIAASKPCSCGCGDTVATCKCGPDCKCRKPGGSCCKTEKTTTKESALGLWDRIRMKKERGGKSAKPGSKDYPDAKSWKKVTAISEKKSDSPAWQRSAGKNDEGGLNEKGRKSYEREHGGNLKAPVTESNPSGDRAKRQNSFCSRMCGMKSVNTGAATAKDPDSRINKSLRKWNCKCSSAVQFGSTVKLSLYRGLQNTPTDTGPEQMQDALFRFNQLRALARPSDAMLQGHNLSRKGFQHEMRRIATSSQDKDRFELSKIAPNPGLRAALAGAAGLAGTGALAYTNGLEGASVGLPLTALAAGGAYLHGQHQRSNLKNTAKLLKNYGLLNPQTLRQAYPLLGDDYSIS